MILNKLGDAAQLTCLDADMPKVVYKVVGGLTKQSFDANLMLNGSLHLSLCLSGRKQAVTEAVMSTLVPFQIFEVQRHKLISTICRPAFIICGMV